MNPSLAAIPALTVVCVLAFILTGCTGPGEPGPSDLENTPAPSSSMTISAIPGSVTNVVDANNRFALTLYAHLADEPAHRNDNLFFSPFSISSALAITWEGARGTTAEEIRSVFHFPEDQSVLRSGFPEVIASMNSRTNAYTLRTANALWAEKTYPFLPDYISTADRYYSAKTTNLDFIHHPEESRVTINQWVEDQTLDRIKDLIPQGEINANTALVITNAIYFKGNWVKQFDPAQTREADFLTGDGSLVRVPMMQRTDDAAIFRYTETDSFQVLEMPYESGNGTELSMLIILPVGNDVEGITRSLDIRTLQEIRQSLAFKLVRVYVPKFTMETKYFLARTLSAMGMPTAFTPGADFSGMDGSRDLFITNVIHQAFVEVNEEGTEAAAATAVIMGKGVAMVDDVPVFRADHPFIFFIQEKETGNILFMGRVSDPV